MSFLKTISMTAFAAVTLLSFGRVQANIISGGLWHVPDAIAGNAIPGNVPAPPADVTFDVNSPFNFFANSGTVGAFLASSGAFNIVGSPATLGSLMSNGNGVTGTGTIINFTGFVSVVHNQTFTVTHDDGLTLIIGGSGVINVPGPTPPITTTVTYTGPTGNFPFQLVYGECCDGPATLQIDLPLANTAVPEPASLVLLGTGLAVFGWARRRFA